MGLKEKYLEAVKATTATYMKDVGGQLPYVPNDDDTGEARAGAGVNYLDGTKRSTNNSTTDTFQTEFTRNTPGANVVGGAQGNYPSTYNKTYPLSRWTSKASEFAFELSTGGPNSFSSTGGFWNTTKFRIKKVGLVDKELHNYIPTENYDTITGTTAGGYINKFDWARTRKNASGTSR